MGRIRDLVHQALEAGYLTMAAEEQLRLLLQTKNEPEELTAFMALQRAAMAGNVKQESRELINLSQFSSLSLDAVRLDAGRLNTGKLDAGRLDVGKRR